jgi:hypothetical protein
MTPRAVNARDAGLRLIARINKWMIAGAVALSGLISVAAARSFHGHTTTAASSASQPSQASSTSSSGSGADGSSANGGGLQQPAQAPSSAAAPAAPAPVVSGGS